MSSPPPLSLPLPISCVVCTEMSISPVSELLPSTSTSTTSTYTRSSEDELVIFFLQSFLKYPLILPKLEGAGSNSSGGDDMTSTEFHQDFVKSYGAPTGSIWFCPACLPTIQEARDLHLSVREIEAKLTNLRKEIEIKVRESFVNAEEKVTGRDGDAIVFQKVRRKVFEQSSKHSPSIPSCPTAEVDVKVKEEYYSDMEEDVEEMGTGSPYYAHEDVMSPGYPVIYPNVKIEVVDGAGGSGGTSTAMIRKNIEYATLDPNDELSETIYERRSRRQVTYAEIDKTESEDDDEYGSDSEVLWEPRGMRKYKNFKSLPKPKREKNTLKVKTIRPRKVRLSKALKNDGRGGHRIKSSVDCRTCPVCQQVFGCHSKMSVHLNVKHLRNVLFNCDVCKKGFMRKDYLRTHMEIHLPEDDRLLKQALRELKGVEKAEFMAETEKEVEVASLESRTCTVCGKTFDKVSILKIHVECVHNNVTRYECKVCHKKFKWKDLLKKHVFLHRHGESSKSKPLLLGSVTPVPIARSFQCEYEGCEAAFRRKRDLEVHLRIHTGAKDFLCSLCGISFRHEWSFRRHNILRHQAQESKKYQCESCGKTFKIKWLLDQHLMSKSHGGAGLPKRTRRKPKDKEATEAILASNTEKDLLRPSPERFQIQMTPIAITSDIVPTPTPTSSNVMEQSERSMDNSAAASVDNDNYSAESLSPVDHNQSRRYETAHFQQYYQQQNFRPDILNLLPHRDILNYSNFNVPNAFGGFGYNVPSNDSQSQ